MFLFFSSREYKSQVEMLRSKSLELKSKLDIRDASIIKLEQEKSFCKYIKAFFKK